MSFIIFPGVITPPLTPGAVPYGTGSNVLMNAQGTAGQVLLSNGASAPTWATAVPSSNNIGGGIAGDLPYQSAPSTTTFRNLVPGAVVYGDATAPNYTAVGTAGQVLQSNATGAPSWTTNISGNAANVTGTVAVANGGTGRATLTAENVILGDGTNNVKFVAPGSSGNVLVSNGTTWTSAPASSGALTLLATSTVTGTPQNLDITWTGTTYDDYLIIAENFRCPNTHRYGFRLANSAGTFITASSYYSSGIKWEGTAQNVRQTANAYIEPFANNSGASAPFDAFGYFYILNANTANNFAAQVTFSWTQCNNSGVIVQGTSTGGMNWDLGTGIRGLRIFDLTTNGIDRGTLRLYGIQK